MGGHAMLGGAHHPKGRADAGVGLGDGVGELLRHSEIGDLDGAQAVEEDVAGLDVAVDDVHGVEVEQPLERLLEDVGDLILLEGLVAQLDHVPHTADVAVVHQNLRSQREVSARCHHQPPPPPPPRVCVCVCRACRVSIPRES
jgi:hypothetical protein